MKESRQEKVRAAIDRLFELAEGDDESGITWLFQVFRHNVGLFWMEEHNIISVGSGVLVETCGKFFIMSCSHTLRVPDEANADKVYLVIYYGQDELQANGKSLITSVSLHPDESREFEADVGAALLSQEGVEILESAGKLFVPLGTGALSGSPNTEEPCLLVGYPDALLKPPSPSIGEGGEREVLHEPQEAIVEAMLAGPSGDERKWRLEKYGKHWPRLEGFHHSVKGMSGGGVWQVELVEDETNYILQNLRLFGVQARTSRSKTDGYLLVEKLETWLEFPAKVFLNSTDN